MNVGRRKWITKQADCTPLIFGKYLQKKEKKGSMGRKATAERDDVSRAVSEITLLL